jgi:hypothetical protein
MRTKLFLGFGLMVLVFAVTEAVFQLFTPGPSLRQGMTVQEVQEVVGTSVSGGGGSISHMTIIYDLDNSFIANHRLVAGFDPQTGRLISWESRLDSPTWLKRALRAVGW